MGCIKTFILTQPHSGTPSLILKPSERRYKRTLMRSLPTHTM